jgi:transposase InsO family protein
MKCEFVMKHVDQASIDQLCDLAGISRSGYYEWRSRQESARSKSNRVLVVAIHAAYVENRRVYGAIRLQDELKDQGYRCSKNRVARLMRLEGLKSVHRQKYRPSTTDSKHELPIANNIIERDFAASSPNRKWGCDITYVATSEGWLYLAVVLDFYSRRIVGWATDSCLHAKLCCDALKMAMLRRQSPEELIHHSDRGVQYACQEYRQLLQRHNVTQSMSRRGNCWDNAMVESLMHTLKVECVHQNKFATKQQARKEIGDYIERFYNMKRKHSALDYQSPNDYEQYYQLAS